MGKFSFTLPPGVLAKLAGVPYCPEAAIARAQSRQGAHGGAEERGDPSCPAASEIGTTIAGAGAGNQLTYVPGTPLPRRPLARGPALGGGDHPGARRALRRRHRGRPRGAAPQPGHRPRRSRRRRLRPDPPHPQGHPAEPAGPARLRRPPEFTLNPTSCAPFAAESTIWGDGTAQQPLAPAPAGLSTPYQAVNCASSASSPSSRSEAQGRHPPRRLPGPATPPTPRGPATPTSQAPRPHLPPLGVHRTGPLPHDLHPGAVRRRGGQRLAVPARARSTATPRPGARCWTSRSKARSTCAPHPTTSPTPVFALHGLVDIDVAARIDSMHGRPPGHRRRRPRRPGLAARSSRMQGGKKGLFVNSTQPLPRPSEPGSGQHQRPERAARR